MKVTVLKRKITISLLLSAVLFTGSVAGYVFTADYISKLKSQKSRITSATSRNNTQISDIKNKAIEVKKYLGLWDKISDNKKITDGIVMDDINTTLRKLASKYNITEHKITVALPKEIKSGIFNRTTLSTIHTVASLDFKSINDLKALAFVTEFVHNLPGYSVVESLNLEKEKTYQITDLVKISAGKGTGVINGKVVISWYAFKDKGDKKVIKPKEK